MNKKHRIKTLSLAVLLLLTSSWSWSGAADDPLLTKVMLNQLELNGEDATAGSWSGQAWLGYDLKKFWIKTEGNQDAGDFDNIEIQALYSQAIAPYWDVQFGVKKDINTARSQEWGVIAIQGLAPYFFEIDASLFVAEGMQAALRLEADYEMLFTQKLILTASIEANFYAKNDEVQGVGSGLSDTELGLRLRYEVIREFAPYIGVNFENRYGTTADFLLPDESKPETQLVIGLRAWF